MYQGVVSKFVLPLSTFCFFRILPISPGKASFCSELFTIAKRKNPNQKSISLYNRSLVEDNRHTDYIFRRQKVQKSFQNVRLWFKTSIFNNLPILKHHETDCPKKPRWNRHHWHEDEGTHKLSCPQSFWTILQFLLKNHASW